MEAWVTGKDLKGTNNQNDIWKVSIFFKNKYLKIIIAFRLLYVFL